jgi:hypothetical protein
MKLLTVKPHGEKSDFHYTRILYKYGYENESDIFYFQSEEEMLKSYNDEIGCIETDKSNEISPYEFNSDKEYQFYMVCEKERFENPKWTIEFKNTLGHCHTGMIDL